METAELTHWNLAPDAAPVRHQNPRLPLDSGVEQTLSAWLESEPRVRGHHLFQTSGSTSLGGGKWVALSVPALTASAAAVNHHLRVGPDDHWLLALPTFHVGGFGIVTRADLAGVPLSQMHDRWSVANFTERLATTKATLTSLVPTQISDLVAATARPPECLRAVLVGGARLDSSLHERALDLGWPLRRSFGMTEAASQVATEDLDAHPSSLGNPWLPLLPSWETRLVDSSASDELSGQLELRGPALFSAYVQPSSSGGWFWNDPKDDGWWRSPDQVQLRDQGRPEGALELQWLGRADRVIKVSGELASLDDIEAELKAWVPPQWRDCLALIGTPDPRLGSKPVLVIEQAFPEQEARQLLERAGKSLAPFERPDTVRRIDRLPKTALGKLRYAELEDRFAPAKPS